MKNDIGCEGSSTETWNPTTFLILSQHQHEVNWWVLSFLNIFPCTILSHRGKFYVNVANLRNFEPFASVQYKYLQWPQTTFNKLGLQDMYCSIHYRRFWAVEKHFFFPDEIEKRKGKNDEDISEHWTVRAHSLVKFNFDGIPWESLYTVWILNSSYTSNDIWKSVKNRILRFDKELVQINLWICESSQLLHFTSKIWMSRYWQWKLDVWFLSVERWT